MPQKPGVRLTVESFPDAFACCEILTDQNGLPYDAHFKEINQAFERLTRLPREQVVERLMSEVLSDVGFSLSDLPGLLEKVIQQRKSLRFEEYLDPLKIWAEMTLFFDRVGFLNVALRDITEWKQEQETLPILVRASQEFLEMASEKIDFQQITENLRLLSGAKYAACNLYEPDGLHSSTVALTGNASHLQRVAMILGYDPVGKRWEKAPATKIGDNTITRFANFHNLTDGIIATAIVSLVENLLSIGEIFVIRIKREQKTIGDFTVFMSKGKTLKNHSLVEIYTRQVGLLITRQRAEQTSWESEGKVQTKLPSILSPKGDVGTLKLSDIINIAEFQSLLNDFHAVTRVCISLLDCAGRVLTTAGPQEICAKFHKAHPVTAKHCLESDTLLSSGVSEGDYKLYRCKNGLWDVATPIVVDGRHLGNLFLGQFFIEEEPIDYEMFRRQARLYGFDEELYITALNQAPHLKRTTLNSTIKLYMKLSGMLIKTSYSNTKLSRSLTERGRLLHRLRESEERLIATLLSIDEGVISTDENARIINFNTAAETLTGWTAEEAQNRPVSEVFSLIDEKTRSPRENPIIIALRQGRAITQTSHTILIAQDGSERFIAGKASIIQNREKVLGAVMVFRDQTDEREISRRLQVSYAAIESSINAIALAKLDGLLFYVNPAFARLWGYSHTTDILEKRTEHFFAQPAQAIRIVDRILKEGTFFGEVAGIRADGSSFDLQCSASLVRDPDGEPSCIMGSFVDITEQRYFQRALRHSEEKFKRIVNNIQDIVYSLNAATGEFSYLSPAFERVLGYSLDDIKKMGGRVAFMSQVLQNDACTQQMLSLEEIRTKNIRKQGRCESWWRCKDGSLKCLEDIWTPIFDGDCLMGSDGVLRDITDRRCAEERIRHLSFHDSLTDLYNRAFLEAEMQRLDTERQFPMGIIIADVNGLKLVNDAYGHQVGDRLLQAAAAVLKQVCRSEDLIGRWGGRRVSDPPAPYRSSGERGHRPADRGGLPEGAGGPRSPVPGFGYRGEDGSV
ncbi:MAG TPA: PAS domain S-box protein [Atribacteraceae bacterium]|nr:PAS domain S-box protein [Atribacteraceae bacterium]